MELSVKMSAASTTKQMNMKEKQNDSEIFGNCFIRKETAKLLSCVLLFNDLYDKVDGTLAEIYGETQAGDLIKEFDRLSREMK